MWSTSVGVVRCPVVRKTEAGDGAGVTDGRCGCGAVCCPVARKTEAGGGAGMMDGRCGRGAVCCPAVRKAEAGGGAGMTDGRCVCGAMCCPAVRKAEAGGGAGMTDGRCVCGAVCCPAVRKADAAGPVRAPRVAAATARSRKRKDGSWERTAIASIQQRGGVCGGRDHGEICRKIVLESVPNVLVGASRRDV